LVITSLIALSGLPTVSRRLSLGTALTLPILVVGMKLLGSRLTSVLSLILWRI
jgi:hypothetical protein